MGKKPIKGVNLGGWLVLEPWITPSLFAGTGAVDEFTYSDTADGKRFHQLSQHRKSFITKQDFKWLAERGIEAVRIPIGYWVFGDQPPYIGGVDYLDKAFDWAEECGLKVLVCLHGAPGSQNGKIHSGQQGDAAWAADPSHVDLSVKIIERLANRYADRPGLLGIELLNEPAKEISRRTLNSYYRRCYRLIRRQLGPEVWVVFSDRFKPRRWEWVFHWPFYRQAYLDHHQYQIYTPDDKALDAAGHATKAAGSVAWRLRTIGWHRKLIVGEWSAALDAQSLAGLDKASQQAAYQTYVQAQLEAYRYSDAWFYWTYRTETGGPWSFRAMHETKILRL